jgi:hypothetical protein
MTYRLDIDPSDAKWRLIVPGTVGEEEIMAVCKMHGKNRQRNSIVFLPLIFSAILQDRCCAVASALNLSLVRVQRVCFDRCRRVSAVTCWITAGLLGMKIPLTGAMNSIIRPGWRLRQA